MRMNPVTRAESPEEVRAAVSAKRALPEVGQDPESLLRDAATLLFEHSLFNGHPRFYGYITSSAAPIGMLADLLAAAVNANVGTWKLSPMAIEIEAQVIRWLAEFIGYRTMPFIHWVDDGVVKPVRMSASFRGSRRRLRSGPRFPASLSAP